LPFVNWLPNLLTLLRVILAPFIIADVLDGQCHVALPLSMIAAFTDAADGYLARRLGVESRLGAWADPLADKALHIGLFISFGYGGLIPVWLVWLVVGRDVLILAMVAFAMATTSIRDFPPTMWGKLSTVIQLAAAVVLLGSCSGYELAALMVPAVVPAVSLITAWSGIHYVWVAVRRRRAHNQIV